MNNQLDKFPKQSDINLLDTEQAEVEIMKAPNSDVVYVNVNGLCRLRLYGKNIIFKDSRKK